MNRAPSTLTVPDSVSLSVECVPVESSLLQLERGLCHTLWHRLDLDFVSDESNTGWLSAYTGGRCWSVDGRTHPSCAALGTNATETVVMKASRRWTGKPIHGESVDNNGLDGLWEERPMPGVCGKDGSDRWLPLTATGFVSEADLNIGVTGLPLLT